FVDVARFPGEGVADVFEILLDMAAHLPRRLHHHGLHPGGQLAGWRLLRAGDGGSHDLLADRRGAADGALDETPRRLLVVIGRGAEPGLEGVGQIAMQGVADHVGGAKSRSWVSWGTARRARTTASMSSSANSTPGASWSSLATTSPHGPTMVDRPQVRRPSSCSPPWAGARMKQPVSMARARSRVSQCASPVGTVKAEGTAIIAAPARARVRNSCGKRRS